MPERDTVVFIPAWNEEKSLPAVLAELLAGLPDADVFVIDDGSTDETAAVARGHGATVVSFGENRGLRAGIAAGYREAFDRGYASASPLERVTQFAAGVEEALPSLFADPLPYVEKLVERVSYVTFFSIVLDYVPAHEPHAEGELLRVAIANSTMPRFLFPEKPVLLSDSYYTKRFSGVYVSDNQTSISIGYMAEFYADWGMTGMFVSVFLYGCWIGLMAALLRMLNPVPALGGGVLIVALLTVSDFEHQFMKGFAALNASVVFMLALLFVLRPWLERSLGVTREASPRDEVTEELIRPRVA